LRQIAKQPATIREWAPSGTAPGARLGTVGADGHVAAVVLAADHETGGKLLIAVGDHETDEDAPPQVRLRHDVLQLTPCVLDRGILGRNLLGIGELGQLRLGTLSLELRELDSRSVSVQPEIKQVGASPSIDLHRLTAERRGYDCRTGHGPVRFATTGRTDPSVPTRLVLFLNARHTRRRVVVQIRTCISSQKS
jgi:hypothetical protein